MMIKRKHPRHQVKNGEKVLQRAQFVESNEKVCESKKDQKLDVSVTKTGLLDPN